MKKTVLITGVSGGIGSILAEALAPAYTIRGLDLRASTQVPTTVAPITDAEVVRTAFAGVDHVIHLAGQSSRAASWEEVLSANIVGTQVVYEAAVAAGVKQVIFASSTHAVGQHDQEYAPQIYQTGLPQMDHTLPVRPDSLYGVSKAAGETLGRYYSDTQGLHVICLRIGWVSQQDEPHRDLPASLRPSLEATLQRLNAIWLSQRDLVHLVEQCLQHEELPFAIFYGISNNQPHYYDLTYAERTIGYMPQDGARVDDVFLPFDEETSLSS